MQLQMNSIEIDRQQCADCRKVNINSNRYDAGTG